MTTKRSFIVALFVLTCVALPAFAQQSPAVTRGPIVIREFKHDVGQCFAKLNPCSK